MFCRRIFIAILVRFTNHMVDSSVDHAEWKLSVISGDLINDSIRAIRSEGWPNGVRCEVEMDFDQKENRLPLTGTRVVQVGSGLAGPVTARYLAHFGADVIRIESRRKPDVLRVSGAEWLSSEVDVEVALDSSILLNFSCAEQRSVALEIDKSDGYDAFCRIVSTADVFVTNLSADVIEQLGLSYEEMKLINPHLVYLSTTAFGQHGPYRSYRTWGINLCALGGIEAMIGWEDREPFGMRTSFPDYPVALAAASAIVAALQLRRVTGVGFKLDLPQFNLVLNCIGAVLVDAALGGSSYERIGNRSADGALQGIYPTREAARWVAFTVEDDAQWKALSAIPQLFHLSNDPSYKTKVGRYEHQVDLDAEISRWTLTRGDWEVAQELQDLGIPASPVFNAWDILADPHLATRNFYQVGNSARFGADLMCRPSAVPADMLQDVRNGAPALGEHTREVLADVAGASSAKIDEMIANGSAYEMVRRDLTLRRPCLPWVSRLLRLRSPSTQKE